MTQNQAGIALDMDKGWLSWVLIRTITSDKVTSVVLIPTLRVRARKPVRAAG